LIAIAKTIAGTATRIRRTVSPPPPPRFSRLGLRGSAAGRRCRLRPRRLPRPRRFLVLVTAPAPPPRRLLRRLWLRLGRPFVEHLFFEEIAHQRPPKRR